MIILQPVSEDGQIMLLKFAECQLIHATETLPSIVLFPFRVGSVRLMPGKVPKHIRRSSSVFFKDLSVILLPTSL